MEVETWGRRRGHERAKLRDMDYLWEVIELQEIKLDRSQGYFDSRNLNHFWKPEHDVVMLAREFKRVECLFGWRMLAVDWYDFESDWLDDERNIRAAAEIHATIIQANLHEHIPAHGYGLPVDCSSDGINWF